MAVNLRAVRRDLPPLRHMIVGSLLMVAGCGEPTVPTGRLSGKVTYQNAPLTDGTVTFRDAEQGRVAAGTLNAAGEYQLLFGGGLEVPAGDYAVTVMPPEVHVPIASEQLQNPQPSETPAGKPNAPQIPSKYRDFNSSGLKATLDEGENSFDIELKD